MWVHVFQSSYTAALMAATYSFCLASSPPNRRLKMRGFQFTSINHAIKYYRPSNQCNDVPAPVPVHVCVCSPIFGTNNFSKFQQLCIAVITRYGLYRRTFIFSYSELVILFCTAPCVAYGKSTINLYVQQLLPS